MKLFILRHGKAGDGIPDALRELKTRGREDVRKVVELRKSDLASIGQIQSSALVRAEQTAAIVAEILDDRSEVIESAHLTPWARPVDFIATIDEGIGDLLVASHQPFVSDLVSYLANDDIWMPTSGLVCLEAEHFLPGTAELLWQENP
jgi:phosphohistidine phosphatase